MADISYSGMRSNGEIANGVADPSRKLADLAQELFPQGWRKASVFRDGRLAGEVKIIDGKRT